MAHKIIKEAGRNNQQIQRAYLDESALVAPPASITLVTERRICNMARMGEQKSIGDSTRFEAALRRFDEENSRDPNIEIINGSPQPRERIYAEWLTAWVLKLDPNASEALRLAARCQHLCRWEVPRNSYPMTRAGYLQWREGLKKFHAQKAGEILRELGYDPEMVARVQELNLKKKFPADAETRVLEDGLCLVFLEHQFKELAAKTSEDKMINALQKSWKKMTPTAQKLALELKYEEREAALLKKALG